MSEKKARFLRKLLRNSGFVEKLPVLKVIRQQGNLNGIVRGEQYYLQVKHLKKLWANAPWNLKHSFDCDYLKE